MRNRDSDEEWSDDEKAGMGLIVLVLLAFLVGCLAGVFAAKVLA